MSISTLQEKIFNKGCGSIFVAAAAILMGASFVTGQCNQSDHLNGLNGAEGSIVGSVDGIPITVAAIQSRAERLRQSRQGQTGAFMEAATMAAATAQAARDTAMIALLTKGAAPSAAEVEKAAAQAVDQRLEGARMQILMQGQAKPDKVDAEFEKLVKAQTGKTPAQYKADEIASFKKAFADTSTKGAVLQELGPAILTTRLGAKAVGDDKSLREAYKTYVVKRIFFSDRSGAKETAAERAAKAEADLKAGVSFDKLMDTVGNDGAAPGKKPHDSTESVPASVFDTRPELASLKGKPLMTTTPVVDVAGGKAIYQLVATQDATPPDFEKNKEKYRDQNAQRVGRDAFEKAITEVLDKSSKWENEGYRALALAADALGKPAVVTKAIDAAKTAIAAKDPTVQRLGAMAGLVATATFPGGSSDPAKESARLTMLEAAQKSGVLDATLSLELADLYAKAKDGEKTTAALIATSRENGRYDAEGERIFREVGGKALKLQGAQVITKPQYEQVMAQQAVWQKAKTDYDKAASSAKTQSADVEKANAEEIARQKAEAAKQGAGASNPDVEKANQAEIARQKAEAAKGKGQ